MTISKEDLGKIDHEGKFRWAGKFGDMKLAKSMFAALYELVKGEVMLVVGQDGLHIQTMDPANVCMIGLHLAHTSFETVEFEGATPYAGINIDMERFMTILDKPTENNRGYLTLELARAEDKAEGTINLIHSDRGMKRKGFKAGDIPTDPATALRSPLTVEFSVTAQVESAPLVAQSDEADAVSDSLVLTAASAGENLTIAAKGDAGTYEQVWTPEIEGPLFSLTNLAVDGAGKSIRQQARYSVDYLQKFAKGLKLGKTVKIEYKEDFPLKLSVLGVDGLIYWVLLAPRIQDSD